MTEETLPNSFQNKILNFVKKNSKKIIILLTSLVLILFIFFFYKDLQKKKEVKISEFYTEATIQFNKKKIDESKKLLVNIINESHKFYSPLALYFIIDNNLEADRLKILDFFDIILSINSIDKENLNLIKIKKAVFLLNSGDEDAIIKILNPIVNSDSVWRNMAIKLMSDYFLSKDQKIKSEEYLQLLSNKIKE
jgi:predicted negative regulator of RcsB-dependent stress response|tara:strand:- start:10304 stop:10885 length:582 start_codon:yes stop_codon:yes gene_type:complete